MRVIHLKSYPDVYYPCILHYSLPSRWFTFSGIYTSLVLSLGFTEHTNDLRYLQASAIMSISACVLLVNSNARMWNGFLEHLYECGVLTQVLSSMTTARLIEAGKIHSNYIHVSYYEVHARLLNELTRRRQIK